MIEAMDSPGIKAYKAFWHDKPYTKLKIPDAIDRWERAAKAAMATVEIERDILQKEKEQMQKIIDAYRDLMLADYRWHLKDFQKFEGEVLKK